jgi:hypothetical protein
MWDMNEYSRRIREKMRSWRFDLDVLKVQSAGDDDHKEELGEILTELEDRFSVLEERLRDFQNVLKETATDATRDQMRVAVDRAWEEAAYAIDHAKSILLH